LVHTKTERLDRIREGEMELYASDHSVLDRNAKENKYVDWLDGAWLGRQRAFLRGVGTEPALNATLALIFDGSQNTADTRWGF